MPDSHCFVTVFEDENGYFLQMAFHGETPSALYRSRLVFKIPISGMGALNDEVQDVARRLGIGYIHGIGKILPQPASP